ncbi:MAG: thioredoxin domain-containing protein [Candidatus Bathyarchaeia archaeon]|jgi:thiol-disulfide isomerase/thioredoxin
MSKRSKEQTEENIEDVLKSKDKAFVLFYASWCPFSQEFLPAFTEYSKANPKECLSVVVDDKPDLCDKYAIEYYPTVLLFKKGKVHKRLDAIPGAGLTKKELAKFTESGNQP